VTPTVTLRLVIAGLLVIGLSLVGCGDEGQGKGGDGGGEPEASLVLACIRATACGIQPYPRVSACVENYLQREVPLGLGPVWVPIHRCTNRARTCKEVQTCFGMQGSCESTFTASCKGGKATYCDLIDHAVYTFDCAQASMQCESDPKQKWSATCTGSGSPGGSLTTTVSCDREVCQKTAASCTTGVMNRCQGERLEACLEGSWVSFDCATLALGPCHSEGSGNTAWARCGFPPQ